MKNTRIFWAGVLACVAGATAQENYATWPNYKPITINTSATGANVAANVLKYPLLVHLTSADSAVFTQGLANGASLRFGKTDGTRLPFKIDRWDATNKVADIWVLVDTVKGNNATQAIRMYWGRPSVAGASNGAAVFAPANGFVGVWNMAGETSEDATGNFLDAYGTAKAYPAGISGLCSELDGSEGQGFIVSNTELLDVTQLTVSVWVNAVDWKKERRIFDRGNSSYYMYVPTTGSITFKASADRGNAAGGTPPVNEWALLTGTWNGTTQRFYVNDVVTDEIATTTPLIVTNAPFSIGRHGGFTADSMVFNGKMDEFRIQTTPRDENWVKLDYMSQKPGSVVVTRGTTVVVPVLGSVSAAQQAFAARVSGSAVSFRFEKNVSAGQISVLDASGNTVWSRSVEAGTTEMSWNGKSLSGHSVAPGVYIANFTLQGQGKSNLVAQSKISLTR